MTSTPGSGDPDPATSSSGPDPSAPDPAAPDAGTSADELAQWQERRREAAVEHAAAASRQHAAEAQQGRRIIADFVREATERGLPTAPLRARAYSGGATYRTHLNGWYVRRNRTLAVGEDGEFYVLSVPNSMRARFAGADVPPEDPPLVVGRGGRDGESMALVDLLRLRLEAGETYP